MDERKIARLMIQLLLFLNFPKLLYVEIIPEVEFLSMTCTQFGFDGDQVAFHDI